MGELNLEKLRPFRLQTYRSEPSVRLRDKFQAIEFVNSRGFVFFWPIKGIVLPSIWVAAAGDRPVPDEHDDPGHITWGWKDELLGTGVWYYGRGLARKNCMISLEVLPGFYALSPNFGEPESDYLEDYQRGVLPQEAKNVFEALLKEGPLDSLSMRKAAHLTGTGTDSRFNKALEVLQTTFRVIPVGISKSGAWHYAFIYDLFHRHFSNQIEQSRTMTESNARQKLLLTYLQSVGACSMRDISRLFRWDQTSSENTINKLAHANLITENVTIINEKHPLIALRELL
jgi:hypothetical protein